MMSLISLERFLFSLADLVHDVLDLVGEVLVLPPDLVKLEHSLLVGRLHPEQLRGGVAGLLLGRVKIHANGIDLALPFANNPVELLGLLLHGQVEDLSLVKGLSLSLQVGGQLGASLVKLGKLGLQLVSGGIGLRETSLHLQLGHLKLLSLGDSLLLVPHTEHVSLSKGLVQGTGKVLLGADLLLVVVLQAGDLVLGVPELAEKGLPLLGLVVSTSPGLVQLVGEGELQLGEHVGRVLHLLQLAEEVSVLGSDLPLGSLHVVEGEGGLLDLLALIIEGAQEVPVRLLRSSLGPVDLVDGSTGIGDLAHDEGLVLLNLVLHLVELLNLLGHLSNGVLVLLLEADEGGLLLDVGLLEIAAELGHLSLTLLVQLDLGRGGSRGLSETLSHVLKLASQVGPLALGLGASLPLGLQLLLELLDMGLVLLDALLDLGNQALLVVKLGEEDAGVLLLALDGGLELLLGPLLVGNGLLGDLQLTLNLPPLLLDVGTATLLLLQRGLQLIQGALKLALDLVEMSHLVLGGGQILSGLGRVLADVLLLLVQLVDHLVLVGDLVVQAADGVVTVGLLLLDLLDGHLDIVNVLLHGGALLLQQLLLGQGILTGSLLGNEGILGVGQVHLQAGDGSGGLGLLVVVDREVALLLLQLSQKSILLLLDGDVLLQQTVLGLQLLVVLAPGGVGLGLELLQLLLGVGQADQAPGLLDDDEPSPVPHAEELPEVPLGNLDQLPLVELLLVHSSTDPLERLSLDEPDPLDDKLVTLLL